MRFDSNSIDASLSFGPSLRQAWLIYVRWVVFAALLFFQMGQVSVVPHVGRIRLVLAALLAMLFRPEEYAYGIRRLLSSTPTLLAILLLVMMNVSDVLWGEADSALPRSSVTLVVLMLWVIMLLNEPSDVGRLEGTILLTASVASAACIVTLLLGQASERARLSETGDPNVISTNIIAGTTIAMAYLLQRRSLGRAILGLGGIFVIVVGVFATASRGGLLVLAISLAVLLVFHARQKRFSVSRAVAVVVAVLLLVLIAAVLFKSQTARLLTLLNFDMYEFYRSGRLPAQVFAVKCWLEHPFLGVGFGKCRYWAPGYRVPIGPHNTYLALLAELGVLGLLVYVLLLVSIYRECARRWIGTLGMAAVVLAVDGLRGHTLMTMPVLYLFVAATAGTQGVRQGEIEVEAPGRPDNSNIGFYVQGSTP